MNMIAHRGDLAVANRLLETEGVVMEALVLPVPTADTDGDGAQDDFLSFQWSGMDR